MLKRFWFNLGWIWYGFGIDILWFLEWIYAFERIRVDCFQAYSHTDITSPSIGYNDGVWWLYIINKQLEGYKSRWVLTDSLHNLFIIVYAFTNFSNLDLGFDFEWFVTSKCYRFDHPNRSSDDPFDQKRSENWGGQLTVRVLERFFCSGIVFVAESWSPFGTNHHHQAITTPASLDLFQTPSHQAVTLPPHHPLTLS